MLLSLVSLLLLSAVVHADTDVTELIVQHLSKPNSDDFHLTQFENNSNYELSEEGVLTLQTNRLQGNLRTEVNGFSITLEYDVKLDDMSPGFLPGLFGGKEECEPSEYGKNCFNVR
ncbi:hypothetical protein K7432_013593 [Basidiobolus ranarum]|uniref:Uncharacterized protein n=1 Tax=Basidiobolus ranarum TaxID=34480 RepID=A0ABR2WIY5_9FUNG